MSKTYKCVFQYPYHNFTTGAEETREGFMLLKAKDKKQASAWFNQHFNSYRILISVSPATKADIRAYHWPLDDADDPVFKLIEDICREKMVGIESRGGLDQRRNDSDDFLEVSVWELAEAMTAAYHAGVEYGRQYGQSEITGAFLDDPA